MALLEILQILKQDIKLKELLEATSEDSKVYMNSYYDKDKTGLVYIYTLLTSDKIKNQSRLEITCIDDDYSKVLHLKQRLMEILITKGDEPLTDNITEVVLNGGGYLFDKEAGLHKLKAIFIIKERMR